MNVLIAAAMSVAFYAVLFVPLERVFRAREQAVLRPLWKLDALFMLGQYLVWNGCVIALLAWLQPRVSLGASLPIALQAVLSVVLGDVSVYWFHRACHQLPVLWRMHAVHHSSEHLDWLAAHREHPLDGLLTALAQNIPALLLGFDLVTISGLLVFRGIWAVFIHSNVRLPLGPAQWLVGDPELHHWHHARIGTAVHNFGNLAPWTDLLFRTHHRPSRALPYPLGCEAAPGPTYIDMLLMHRASATADVADKASSAGTNHRAAPLGSGPTGIA